MHFVHMHFMHLFIGFSLIILSCLVSFKIGLIMSSSFDAIVSCLGGGGDSSGIPAIAPVVDVDVDDDMLDDPEVDAAAGADVNEFLVTGELEQASSMSSLSCDLLLGVTASSACTNPNLDFLGNLLPNPDNLLLMCSLFRCC